MKYLSLFLSIFALSFFYSCEGPTSNSQSNKEQKPSEQIDVAVDDAKELLDVFSKKAKEFLEGEEIDKIKDLADEVKDKAKEIQKDSAIWKAKLEELTKDEDIKVLLEKYKKESEDIFKSIEDILGEIEEKNK